MKRKQRKKSSRARRTEISQREAFRDHMFLATRALFDQRMEMCEREARKALRVVPGQVEATLLVCEVLSRAGRSLEILPLLQEAVQRHPKDPRLYYPLAVHAISAGRVEEARRAILKCLDLLRTQPEVPIERRGHLQAMARDLLRRIKRQMRADSSQRIHADRERVTVASAEPARPAAAGQGLLFSEVAATRPAAVPPPPAASLPPPAPAGARVAGAPARAVVRFEEGKDGLPAWPAWIDDPWSDDLEEREMLLDARRITFVAHYEDLLCLPTLAGVEKLEYQVETARKILRRLGGRALLCDEVGLGKTIEAGMVIKEYLLRGLAQSVLVLVPPGLVQQWREEMSAKFGLEFVPWGERGAANPPGPGPVLAIGSIALARLERNLEVFSGKDWDLVVVDEAHHLRRRSSRSWALVSALRRRYLLLLSATPVHNNLMELYELVTLVRPGLLGTPAEFRRNFVEGKDHRRARDPDRLRTTLQEVMVRNTRSHADVALPRRFATTLVLQPRDSEARTYELASRYVNLLYPGSGPAARMALRHLLASAGSGPRTVKELAERWLAGERGSAEGGGSAAPSTESEAEGRRMLAGIVEAAQGGEDSAKAHRLLELLAGSDEQAVVFCRYRATLAELSEGLAAAGISRAVYHGGLARDEKDRAIETFRAGARVLLSTESGGEGRNLQFCRTIVNYDLPWDPMLIEQRIGRVHRFGQRRDVFVFNLVLAGTLEEEMLRILEEKIHLFELIVGEVDSILGHLERREEFADILLDLWAGSRDEAERRARFDAFGKDLASARAAYEADRALEDSLFADDLEA